MDENLISGEVVDAAMTVHRILGPGLLESVYETVLAHELTSRGFEIGRQVAIPIEYRGLRLDTAFRADLVVQSAVLVELKSVRVLSPVHRKQTLSYLRLSNLRLALLLNFGEAYLKDGIVRIANGMPHC